MNPQIFVGKRIKTFRETKRIELKELSEQSGITIENLQYIEQNDAMPSLSELIKIARAMGVRVGTFLDDNEHNGPVVTYANQSTPAPTFRSNNNDGGSPQMVYQSLSHDKAGRSMESFVIDVVSTNATHNLSTHEGEEFIYVLQGEIEIVYGKEIYQLTQGDSIYYDSVVPHHVHCVDGQNAKILAVVHTPH